MTPTQFKQHRQTLGLTQLGLAKALGLTKDTISKIERGKLNLIERTENAITALVKLHKLENGE